MSTNPYFNHYDAAREQALYDSLIVESVQIYGFDCVYLPREVITTNPLMGEFSASKFSTTYTIEIYPKTVTGWQGSGDLLTKMGLDIQDRFIFQMARSRWDALSTPYSRPREGDIIYWPMMKALFEIKFVEHEQPFYQTGSMLHVYELQCEKWVYNNEMVATGIPDIDAAVQQHQYQQTLVLDLTTGTGVYEQGEIVYQGVAADASDAVTGIAQSFDEVTGILVVTDRTSTWANSVLVIGLGSGAQYQVANTTPDYTANTLVDNATINTMANNVVDSTETNPFADGM